MDFSYGVKVMVTLTKEPNYSYYYENSRDVYDKLESYVGHYEAAEAEVGLKWLVWEKFMNRMNLL